MLRRKTPQADLENKRSTWRALGFVATLSLILSALAWTSYDVAITRALDFEADLLEDEEIPVNVVTPPPPPPPPQQTTVIEIVDDEEEIEEELEIEDIELDEDTEIEIIEDEEDFEDDTPFMIVENMPAFGPCTSMRGDERHQCTQMEIIKYVSSNTKYPPIAKDAGIQGTVFVYFVVGKNGKVRDVKVLREVDPRLDKEATRVVESLPTFEPGQQRGKSVSVQYTIPVKFIIR
jgi:protein TonB